MIFIHKILMQEKSKKGLEGKVIRLRSEGYGNLIATYHSYKKKERK